MIVIENSLSIVRVIEGNIYSTGNHRTWGSINCNFPFHPSIESRLPFFSLVIRHPFFTYVHGDGKSTAFGFVGYIPNTIICGLYTQYHWIWGLWPYYHYIPEKHDKYDKNPFWLVKPSQLHPILPSGCSRRGKGGNVVAILALEFHLSPQM